MARLVTRDSNRWSDNDEPTLYLAGDPGVAMAELGRHWGERGAPAAVWSLKVDLAAVIDLREPGRSAFARAARRSGLDPRRRGLSGDWQRDFASVATVTGSSCHRRLWSTTHRAGTRVIFVERLRTDVEAAIQVEAMLLEVSPTVSLRRVSGPRRRRERDDRKRATRRVTGKPADAGLAGEVADRRDDLIGRDHAEARRCGRADTRSCGSRGTGRHTRAPGTGPTTACAAGS